MRLVGSRHLGLEIRNLPAQLRLDGCAGLGHTSTGGLARGARAKGNLVVVAVAVDICNGRHGNGRASQSAALGRLLGGRLEALQAARAQLSQVFGAHGDAAHLFVQPPLAPGKRRLEGAREQLLELALLRGRRARGRVRLDLLRVVVVLLGRTGALLRIRRRLCPALQLRRRQGQGLLEVVHTRRHLSQLHGGTLALGCAGRSLLGLGLGLHRALGGGRRLSCRRGRRRRRRCRRRLGFGVLLGLLQHRLVHLQRRLGGLQRVGCALQHVVGALQLALQPVQFFGLARVVLLQRVNLGLACAQRRGSLRRLLLRTGQGLLCSGLRLLCSGLGLLCRRNLFGQRRHLLGQRVNLAHEAGVAAALLCRKGLHLLLGRRKGLLQRLPLLLLGGQRLLSAGGLAFSRAAALLQRLQLRLPLCLGLLGCLEGLLEGSNGGNNVAGLGALQCGQHVGNQARWHIPFRSVVAVAVAGCVQGPLHASEALQLRSQFRELGLRALHFHFHRDGLLLCLLASLLRSGRCRLDLVHLQLELFFGGVVGCGANLLQLGAQRLESLKRLFVGGLCGCVVLRMGGEEIGVGLASWVGRPRVVVPALLAEPAHARFVILQPTFSKMTAAYLHC